MKRLIIALVLIVIVTVVCAGGYLTFIKRTGDMIGSLEESYNLIDKGDFDGAKRYALKFEEEWENSRRIFFIMMKHRELLEIERKTKALSEAARISDPEQFRMMCAETLELLRELAETQSPTVSNIF
jgi:hypothetical protein